MIRKLKVYQREELIDRQELVMIERARRSLLGFILYTKPNYKVNWHHRVICNRVQDWFEGKGKRNLMLEVPPQHGKSEIVSRRFPPWAFGQNQSIRAIAASYNDSLATSMARDAQKVMSQEEYARIFPHVKLSDKYDAKTSTERTSNSFGIVGHEGKYYGTGVGGGVTGRSGDLLMVDDPFKSHLEANSKTFRDRIWNWFSMDLLSRAADENTLRIMITNTRWHEDDLSGRLLSQEPENWDVIKFPAIATDDLCDDDHRTEGEALWPERYSTEYLLGVKKTVGSQIFESLWQQSPTNPEGGRIKRAWIKFYKVLPAKFDEMAQSWDLSFKDTSKSDFVAGQVWGRIGAEKYLVHRVNERLDFVGSIAEITAVSRRFPKAYAKYIEDKANGPAVISALKKKITGLIGVEPEGSKEARVFAMSPEWEAGNVYLPHPDIAPWVNDYIENVVGFPNLAHDDEIDATSQMFAKFGSSAEAWLNQMVTM